MGIDHLSIRVSDYQRSKQFYGRLFKFLGFEVSDEYDKAIGWTNGKTRFWISPADGKGHEMALGQLPCRARMVKIDRVKVRAA